MTSAKQWKAGYPLAAAIVALGCALCLVVARPSTAAADDLSDLSAIQQEIQEHNADYKEAQEQVDELQAQIDEIFSPLSQVNGLAPTPDAEREYVVEIWEPETVKLGQSADDVGEYKGLEVVTYKGSDVVTLTVVPISLSINLSSEGGVADAIRALAN